MTTRNRNQKQYLDDLLYRLRLHDVPGARIGEILAEVEAHAAATGEPLQEAFGEPKEYARQWAPPRVGPPVRSVRYWLPKIPQMVLGGVAGWAIAEGAVAVGRGEPSMFGLPALLVLVTGVVIFLGAMATITVDRVVDPRSGASLTGGRRSFLLGMAGVVALFALSMIIVGVLTP